jgi:hypothetical protein
MPVSLNELFTDALRMAEIILAFENGTKVSNAKFVKCYLELFLGVRYENPRENRWGLFPEAD